MGQARSVRPSRPDGDLLAGDIPEIPLDPTGDLLAGDIPEIPLPFDRPKAGRIAMIVNLPSLESIGLGLELARLGYRPVPLFNACPRSPGLRGEVVPEVVPVTPLLWALVQGAERLKSAGLSGDAPPAFLIDANRLGGGKAIDPGWFDNRWVVFETDLPSAHFLAEHQITAVELIHRGAPAEDLLDVLREWHRAGISLEHTDLDRPGPPSTLDVRGTWFPGLSRLARRSGRCSAFDVTPEAGTAVLSPSLDHPAAEAATVGTGPRPSHFARR